MTVKTTRQLISVLTANAGITVAELSRRLGVSPQFLNGRIRNQKFSIDEWSKIFKVCGCKFEMHVYSDDDVVDISFKPTT